jgi:hypothetical protein
MTLENFIKPITNTQKSWLFILTIVAISLGFMFKFSEVKAQDISINASFDCSANSVMRCGAGSVSSITDKYNKGDGHNSAMSIQDIYSYYGITSSDIASMSSPSTKIEAGWVGINGHVYDSANKLVATNAITGGRENIAGSTRADVDGTVFYVRPPSVSFQKDYLSAYVVMDRNNQFKFAILASCGNAVKATPVAKPAPVVTPTTTPTPTPIPPTTPTPVTNNTAQTVNQTVNNTCSGNVSDSTQSGNCNTINNTSVIQQTQNNVTPTPPPTTPVPATTTTVETVAPTKLVNTGPGTDMAYLFVGGTIIGVFSYRRILRHRLDNQQT